MDESMERDIFEFPDDDAWEALKQEIMSQKGDPDGEDS